MTIAITRDVSPAIASAELTHLERTYIDYTRAVEEHRAYRDTLRALGCEVVELPGDARYPDCVFVEDTAIVLPRLAVITRPGAESRRGETRAIADALDPYRPLVHIEAPATIDGGDVLVAGERMYVGLSSRTNEAAIGQLRFHTRMEVIPIPVGEALHLKTAVTRVAHETLLVNRAWIDVAHFRDWKLIEVDPEEPFAANALRIGNRVVFPSAFVKTRARLEAHGIEVVTVDASELAKAEGGVTCSSLIFD